MKPMDPTLARLVPEARRDIAVLVVCGAAQGLAAIGQAFALAWVLVSVVENRAWGAPATWCVAAFAARAAASGAAEMVAARAGVRVSAALRRRLLTKLLRQDAAARDDSGRLLTLATQGATSVEPYVARYLPALANAAVLPVAAIVAMIALDPVAGLIPVLTVPLLPVFAALIGSATNEATARRWRTLSRVSGHFLDVMRGLPTLVSYGRARAQTSTIRDVSHQHREATVATLRLAFLSSAALELLATISVALVTVWTGIALAQGRMELWPALPLILLAPEAYWPIRRVGAEFHAAADGAAALRDMAGELGGQRSDAARPVGRRDGSPVRVREVRYSYGEGLPLVLDQVTLDLSSPGLTIVTGPTGAGKTTLLEIVAGLRQPTSGQVEAPPAHLVTQRPFLAPLSLRDNLLLGVVPPGDRAPGEGRLHQVLAVVGLTDLVRSLPDGVDTMLGDDGFGLSAGQRARVAIARAVLSPAPLLLFDEPTAHLDPRSESLVTSLLYRLSRDRAVVAVTHRDTLRRLPHAHVELPTVAA
ncbi:MAG: thiol reductant ABC exporter subunit CydD [Dermatophilaceae bacterium]